MAIQEIPSYEEYMEFFKKEHHDKPHLFNEKDMREAYKNKLRLIELVNEELGKLNDKEVDLAKFDFTVTTDGYYEYYIEEGISEDKGDGFVMSVKKGESIEEACDKLDDYYKGIYGGVIKAIVYEKFKFVF